MTKGIKIIIFLFIVFIIFLLFAKKYSNKDFKYLDIKIGQAPLRVALADNVFLRKQGLSGKENLEKDQGMLFIFKVPLKYSFWMKGMRFSIDVIWINKDKKVIGFNEDIKKDFSKLIKPPGKVKYVLETKNGFVAKNKIKIGDELIFKNY